MKRILLTEKELDLLAKVANIGIRTLEIANIPEDTNIMGKIFDALRRNPK